MDGVGGGNVIKVLYSRPVSRRYTSGRVPGLMGGPLEYRCRPDGRSFGRRWQS